MNRVVVTGMSGMWMLAGCAMQPAPDDNDNASPSARVRIVHASPDAPAVDICVDGAPAFENVAFASATDYVELPDGTYDTKVTATGAGCGAQGVIGASLPLTEGTDTTVLAVNFLADIEPLVLADNNNSPADGNARVRFVHASPNAPAVDITLTDGTTLFNDIAFKDDTTYLEVAAGTVDLEVRDASGTLIVLTLEGVSLEDGRVYTVFAVGLLAGEPALDALITVDN